jgi:hypothetical protein
VPVLSWHSVISKRDESGLIWPPQRGGDRPAADSGGYRSFTPVRIASRPTTARMIAIDDKRKGTPDRALNLSMALDALSKSVDGPNDLASSRGAYQASCDRHSTIVDDRRVPKGVFIPADIMTAAKLGYR